MYKNEIKSPRNFINKNLRVINFKQGYFFSGNRFRQMYFTFLKCVLHHLFITENGLKTKSTQAMYYNAPFSEMKTSDALIERKQRVNFSRC